MPLKKTKTKTTRKKSSTKTKRDPNLCMVCPRPAAKDVGDGTFCLWHAGLDLVGQYAETQDRKIGGVIQLAASMIDRAVENDLHKKAMFAYAMRKQQQAARMRAAQSQQASPPPPPPSRPDPFALLGLDRANVTPERVRARQRELARIFHTDTGAGAAANDRLAEINAAADEAVRILNA